MSTVRMKGESVGICICEGRTSGPVRVSVSAGAAAGPEASDQCPKNEYKRVVCVVGRYLSRHAFCCPINRGTYTRRRAEHSERGSRVFVKWTGVKPLRF